ncbi:hypothetical protein VCR14J2_440002 [Vibrio coralliirubri]|nr:hypothetical protein VCR14J2_440002 [Vibrio coralliirubri]
MIAFLARRNDYLSFPIDFIASVIVFGDTPSNLLKSKTITRKIYLTKSFFEPYQLSYHRNYIYL